MNEKDYRYVLTIAACRSFSRAADHLYVSQPYLSRYISKLEKELGVTLIDRSASPIQLTSAGIKFCSYATAIVELESALRNDLTENSHLSGKAIKVGAPYLSGEYILSRVLPRVINKFPSIKVDPIQGYSKDLYQRLSAHQIDVAFLCLTTPISDPTIFSERIILEEVYLVGNRRHPALAQYDTAHADFNHPLILDVSTLKGVSLIHCKPVAIISFIVEETLNRMKFKPEAEIKASSLPLAFDLAAQGVGFTPVLRCQLKYGPQRIVQSLCPIALDNCMLSFYVVYNHQNRRNFPELDIFLKEVFEEYQDAPYI